MFRVDFQECLDTSTELSLEVQNTLSKTLKLMTDEKLISKSKGIVLQDVQVFETKICITLLLICHVRQSCNTSSASRELCIIDDGKPEMLVPCDLFKVYSSWIESLEICRDSN